MNKSMEIIISLLQKRKTAMLFSLKLVAGLLVLAGCLACIPCDDNTVDEQPPFKIIVLSDTHVRIPGNPDDAFYDNQENLDNLQAAVSTINDHYQTADFVAVTGDLVGCLFSEEPADYLQDASNPASRFKEIMDELYIPYHVTLGNHDYQTGFDTTTGGGISTTDIIRVEAIWDQVLSIPPYYSFVHNGVNFVFLNSNRGALREETCSHDQVEKFCTGSFGNEQLQWLAEVLERPEPAILFFHHPIITDSPNTLWAVFKSFLVDPEDDFYDVIAAQSEKIMAIFVGHGHFWQSDTLYGGIDVYETAAIGDMLGSADHISVVEINPEAFHVTVTRHQEDI